MKLDKEYKKYLFLLFIYVVTIVIVFYFSSLYRNLLKTSDTNSFNDVTSTKYDVLYNNVYNYSLEHSEFKIYVSDKYYYDDEVLYIDSSKVNSKNINRLLFDFGYNYNIDKGSVPFYIVFKDGKIKEIVHD